jgi:hypothetical protein
MLVLAYDDVARLLPMEKCIEVMKEPSPTLGDEVSRRVSPAP